MASLICIHFANHGTNYHRAQYTVVNKALPSLLFFLPTLCLVRYYRARECDLNGRDARRLVAAH